MAPRQVDVRLRLQREKQKEPASITPQPRDIVQELMPTWLALGVTGAIAMVSTPHGYTHPPFSSFLGKIMRLESILLASIWIYSLYAFCVNLGVGDLSFNLQVRFVNYVIIAQMGVIMLIVNVVWHKDVVSYVNEWVMFQKTWYKVIGTPLQFSSRMKSLYITLIGCVIAVAFGGIEFYRHPWGSFTPFITFTTVLYVWSIPFLFGLSCVEVGRVASAMSKAFKQKRLAQADGVPRVQDLCEFQQLWRSLCALSRRTSWAWRHPLMNLILCCTCIILLDAYALLSSPLGNIEIAQFILLPYCGVLLFNICSCAGRAAYLVDNSMKFELIRCNLPPTGSEANRCLRLFLDTIKGQTAEMSLSGFATVNRQLLISMTSMIATYLVVLAQLSLSVAAIRKQREGYDAPGSMNPVS